MTRRGAMACAPPDRSALACANSALLCFSGGRSGCTEPDAVTRPRGLVLVASQPSSVAGIAYCFARTPAAKVSLASTRVNCEPACMEDYLDHSAPLHVEARYIVGRRAPGT
jgi:hypothetical protein